jgi:hypothetical protein
LQSHDFSRNKDVAVIITKNIAGWLPFSGLGKDSGIILKNHLITIQRSPGKDDQKRGNDK